jgi:hypothetical protein
MKKSLQKRKNYSVGYERSLDLSRCALKMSEELRKNVSKQSILDALISTLTDQAVYKKIVKILQ